MLVSDDGGRRLSSSKTPGPPAPPLATPSTRYISRVSSRLRPLGIDVVPLVVVIDCGALAAAQWVAGLGALPTVLLGLLILILNAAGGHYKARIAPSLLDELPSLAGRAVIAGTIASILQLQFPDVSSLQSGPINTCLLFLVLAGLGRGIGYPLVRRYRKSGQVGRATIIVGCGRVGNQLAATLLEHPEYGLRPVGYVDDDPLIPAADRRVPLLGDRTSLVQVLVEHDVRTVIIAFTASRESVMVDMLRSCDRLACEIMFVPRLYELHAGGRDTEVVWGLPLIRLTRASYRSLMWSSKRAFDVLLAGLSMVLLSPLLAICALAVRLDGGPGIIFRQERVGLDGQEFTIFKFRTLTPSNETESPERWNIVGDPRMSRVGKVMRQLSLDELPQLWNIVRGDMSLVGPRPERPAFVEQFAERFPRYVARHRVPAGLTGWAQVNGLRGDTDIADRASFDNYYIENWSMWADIKILLRTAAQVVGRRGG